MDNNNPSWGEVIFGENKLSNVINIVLYSYIGSHFVPNIAIQAPTDFLQRETHHYSATDYTQDEQRVDTSLITVSGPDYDTHIFNGFKGLNAEEAQGLVDAHYYGVEDPYKFVSKYHYTHPDYDALISGVTIPEIALNINPDIEYSARLMEHITHRVSEKMLYKLDSFTSLALPYDRELTMDDYEKASPIITALTGGIVQQHIITQPNTALKRFVAKHDRQNTRYNQAASVQSSVFNERVLYLEIPNFTYGITEQTQDAYHQAKEKYGAKLESIIIDLRDNGGGYATETAALADTFTAAIDLGKLIYSASAAQEYIEHIKGSRDQITTLPIKILINDETASAAEVFAGTLQDTKRAKLFGKTPSYGKGISYVTLDNYLKATGASLTVTNAALYLPKSGAYQAIGIQPDVLVKMTPRDHEYERVYMKDFPNHLPNPESKTELPKATFKCAVDFKYAVGEKQAWYMKDNMSTGKAYQVNLGYDETMLCALDDIGNTPQYSTTTRNIAPVPSV